MDEVSQEVAVTSFFLSLKNPGHGFCGFLLLLWIGWGCGAGCMADGSPGFRKKFKTYLFAKAYPR